VDTGEGMMSDEVRAGRPLNVRRRELAVDREGMMSDEVRAGRPLNARKSNGRSGSQIQKGRNSLLCLLSGVPFLR